MKKIKKYKEFLNENLSEEILNNILDKISEFGLDSLSNHERALLKSYSDKSIDTKEEIEKHINKYKTSKEVIKSAGLNVDNSELEKNIGRYVRFKDKSESRGIFANMGMVYEIVAVQKHWGYVDGKYVPHKIGYRMAEVGDDNDFGRVGDIDEIEFVNITEDDAIKINNEIHTYLENK